MEHQEVGFPWHDFADSHAKQRFMHFDTQQMSPLVLFLVGRGILKRADRGDLRRQTNNTRRG